MSPIGFTQSIRDAAQDRVLTGEEMRRILSQAEADGVVTREEQRVLRELLATNKNTLSDDARRQLRTFLTNYANGGDHVLPTTESAAIELVLRNFELVDTAAGVGAKDHLISRADLEAIIDAPGSSEALKAAARHLLSRFNSLSNSAGVRGGNADGLISARDLEVAGAVSRMSAEQALRVVRANFAYLDTAGGSERNGLISRASLQAALTDPTVSDELKAAARFLLSNRVVFDRADVGHFGGRADGLISATDIDVTLQGEGMSARRAAQVLIDNFDAADRAAGVNVTHTGCLWWRRTHVNGDGVIERRGLEAIIASADASPELKAAARFLLENSEAFTDLDEAGGAERNGYISLHSLRSFVDANPGVNVPAIDAAALAPAAGLAHAPDSTAGQGPMNEIEALELVLANFNLVDNAGNGGGRDGLIERRDLEAILRSPAASERLKMAARALLSRFSEYDDAAGLLGRGDGKIARVDITAAIARARQAPPVVVATPPPPPPAPAAAAPRAPVLPDRTNEILERDIDQILMDPSLTVEDQVAFILMLIAKEMDKQIQHQMQHIAELQRQQTNTQPGQQRDTSIDIETMKLKRLVDKRGQMFDMLRQIIDKYNQTAKGIIDTIGR